MARLEVGGHSLPSSTRRTNGARKLGTDPGTGKGFFGKFHGVKLAAFSAPAYHCAVKMKTSLTFALLLGLACCFASAKAVERFFLVHVPSETLSGPHTYETGSRLGPASDPWRIRVVDEKTFNLADLGGRTNGPFVYADRATVTVAGVSMILSTNVRLMMELRDRQKQWAEHPETNPRVLATIRGNQAEGYAFIRSEPDALVVKQPNGVTRINLALLPEDIQKKFAYDAAAAAAYSKERAAAAAAWRQQQSEQNAARLEALEKFWSTATPPEVVQPDFPEPYFATQGLGTTKPGASVTSGNGNNNRNNRNSNGNRTITIGGNKKD